MVNSTNENNNEGMKSKGNNNPGKNEDQLNQKHEQGRNHDEDQNKKWDQAQRRHQASPRGYNENLDSQNTENQKTLADEEQIDQPDQKEDPNDPKNLGDQISKRQQTIDEGDPPENKKGK